MSGPFIDQGAPSSRSEWPRGLVAPPEPVRERLEKERAKHAPEAFARAFERLLNDWTVGYYFEGAGQEVLYRPTAQGPEVLAVGLEEVLALKKTLPLEEQRRLRTFLGY